MIQNRKSLHTKIVSKIDVAERMTDSGQSKKLQGLLWPIERYLRNGARYELS